MKRIIITVLLSAISYIALAQETTSVETYWEEVKGTTISYLRTQYIQARKFKKLSIDESALKKALVNVRHRNDLVDGNDVIISLLNPDGRITKFKVQQNTTMNPGLCEKFPSIRTYDLKGIDDLNQIGKMDITPQGFHAMVMSDKSTFFIDPMFHGETEVYMSYYRSDFFTDKLMECQFHSSEKTNESSISLKSFGSCELRTYRCAISATGEYTAFHGGTLILAQAAQVTTMNRVNGVFERDIAVTMEIISNNDLIVYTNSNTDPFTNGSPGNMISENQANTNSEIGSANYDIGHVFGTNSGGLAGLGVVCSNNNKARGVTGSSAPVGDPFDIDYVAHEMGHQFKGNHSFNNSCNGNRNNNTAMEPGSGSTIMAYAGICSPNVQSNSDDHFHGVNLEEIGGFITGNGNSCAAITQLFNVSPVISSTNGNVSVPGGTPFVLTAVATDLDGDPLTYCWEQMDNEISTQEPDPTSVDGPNFRSNSPSVSPSRYFPSLATVTSGGNDVWEVLPSVSRTMNFRVFVRDNSITGGCNDHADVTLSVDANSGPFVLNYPSTGGISWAVSSTETILWDVANTDNSPVSCSFVDIMLSTDGGLTYPVIVAMGVVNDGSENITVPNNVTTTARIRVMSANGTFYDISNNNFEITAANNMVANFTSNNTAICEGASIDFTDASAGNPVSWSWVFNGGNPSISSDQNPVGIQYSSSGTYDVELTVSDGVSTNTITETSYVNVSSCLGTSYLLNNEFTIYPNPVYDKVTIEFTNFATYQDLKIIDNLGKVIFQKGISSSMIENIDMSKYSSGLYSFMLSGGQKTRVIKVFKK